MSVPVEFVYDPRKALANLRKHGVSFAEAETVFEDRHAITVRDEAHSEEEEREVTIGMSERFRLLLVVHTEKDHEQVRIISARKANSFERQQYPSEIGRL